MVEFAACPDAAKAIRLQTSSETTRPPDSQRQELIGESGENKKRIDQCSPADCQQKTLSLRQQSFFWSQG